MITYENKTPNRDLESSIAKIVRENGYSIGSLLHYRTENPDECVIGILKDREPKRGFLGFKKGQRAYSIGQLWLENYIRNANRIEKWVLEVYGKDFVPELKNLAENLSAQYCVDIEVQLISQTPCFERYRGESKGLGW